MTKRRPETPAAPAVPADPALDALRIAVRKASAEARRRLEYSLLQFNEYRLNRLPPVPGDPPYSRSEGVEFPDDFDKS